MLHIIGILLKCIGILLAVILGLIVLVLVTVLFVPIRFEVNAAFPGKTEEITAAAKVTWLLHLIRADVGWREQKLYWRVRAAWKVFEEKTEEEVVEKAVKEEITEKTESVKHEVKNEVKKTEHTEHKKSEKEQVVEKPSSTAKLPDAKEQSEETVTEEKKSIFERIREKIQSVLARIKCTFQKICDKIRAGLDLKEKIVEFLTDNVHKAAFMRVKKELIWLKRFFKLIKGNINLKFGFEDPAVTGQALAVLSVFYALLEGNIYVEPDFEEKCLEGSIYLKGRIRLIHPTMLAVKVILDKNVRQTYKDIMALKNSFIIGGEEDGSRK